MAKDAKTTEPSKSVIDNNLAGRVSGLRATAADTQFDIEDKKGHIHTLRLESSAASLTCIVATAYASGKKLHVVTTGPNGAGLSAVAELRLGNKPKAAKAKAPKPPKVSTGAKQAAEYAAAPAKQAAGD